MKRFFDIELHHEYDQGLAQHLSIVSSVSLARFQQQNSVLFRTQPGSLECYIEDDESIRNAMEYFTFWVICNDEAFYSYTALDFALNFYKPHFYWSNAYSEASKLKTSTISEKLKEIDGDENVIIAFKNLLNEAPKNAIGLLQIKLGDVVNGNETFVGEFKVKKTIWQYNIIASEEQKEWSYKIEDVKNEWQFEQIEQIEAQVTFQSIKPIGYNKRVSNRLKLIWEPQAPPPFEAKQMILPFANYAYIMVSDDSKALTPIYIYI